MSQTTIIALPLTKLTRKDTRFEWSDLCSYGFNELETLLMLVLVLTLPNGNEDFMIFSDYSTIRLGCGLC